MSRYGLQNTAVPSYFIDSDRCENPAVMRPATLEISSVASNMYLVGCEEIGFWAIIRPSIFMTIGTGPNPSFNIRIHVHCSTVYPSTSNRVRTSLHVEHVVCNW